MNSSWLLVQHAPWEGPGLIAKEATERGISLRVAHMEQKESLPFPSELAQFGGLIVMGGPMSANDTASFPNLDCEKRLIAAAVAEGLPVLGVCLGAQLLAAALGARVYRGPAPEVGFGRVRLTREGVRDPVLGSEAGFPAIHWHEETFDLPPGATLLASTERYRNQAFRVGTLAYGFQFHVELDAELAEAWAPHLPEGVPFEKPDREAVERAGRLIIGRFFELAVTIHQQERR